MNLQNGGTFSTSSDFATITHANDRGVFVGEANGGGYFGNNSALMYDIRLPHSEITYYIPIRYYTSVTNTDLIGRGVPADYETVTSYQDHLDDKDISMIKAKQILSLKK
ncbi:MAG: hypothetical protein ACI8QD_000724 [Cyclobacteriaceae bacterium]|jgi:hypothetical protein